MSGPTSPIGAVELDCGANRAVGALPAKVLVAAWRTADRFWIMADGLAGARPVAVAFAKRGQNLMGRAATSTRHANRCFRCGDIAAG